MLTILLRVQGSQDQAVLTAEHWNHIRVAAAPNVWLVLPFFHLDMGISN